MDIIDYHHKLSKMNWNYKDEKNPYKWQEGHFEYIKMNKESFKSPEHRKMWIAMRKKHLTNSNLYE